MWKIVLSHTWFKWQCILMTPLLWFCNKHQYWEWLKCEVWLKCAVWLSKTVLRWLFWKGRHLVSSWYICIMEMRTQSTFNHNISLSLSTIWVEEAEYIEEEEGEEWCERLFLSHTWFKCQFILMICSLSFCNKHQYWNWLRHEDWLSKAELRWLFWKEGHLV